MIGVFDFGALKNLMPSLTACKDFVNIASNLGQNQRQIALSIFPLFGFKVTKNGIQFQ